LHYTENSTNMHQGTLKEFSYSVVRLEGFAKTHKELKTIQDTWLILFTHDSKMIEEVEEVFDDEPNYVPRDLSNIKI
jgi:hypothetical protein